MRQHMVNLMPEELRLQSQAGVRRGQTVAAYAVVLVVLFLLITHSSITRNQEHERMAAARGHADIVIELEERYEKIARSIEQGRAQLRRYQRIALPLNVSDVIASVINQLPHSVVLEDLEIAAGERRRPNAARAARNHTEQGPAPRRLTADISGFAASDMEIAEMIERLSSFPPLENVSLDFSRTRMVNDRLAREFRLSFNIDLDMTYQVAFADTPVVSAERTSQEAP